MTGVGGHRELLQPGEVGQLVLTESHRDEAGWELRAGTPDSQNIIVNRNALTGGTRLNLLISRAATTGKFLQIKDDSLLRHQGIYLEDKDCLIFMSEVFVNNSDCLIAKFS